MHLRATNAHLRSLVREFSTPIKNISTFMLFVCYCCFGGGGPRTLVRREISSKYYYKLAIIDPPAKRHLKMAFRWHVDDSPILNADRFFKGSGPLLLKTDIVVNSFTARRFFNCLLTYMK